MMNAAIGMTVIAIPASATALAEAATTAPPPAGQGAGASMEIDLSSHRIAYGRDVVLKGRAPAGEVSQRVTLEFASGGSRVWRGIASTHIGSSGHFRLLAPLRHSGALKVVSGGQPAAQPSGSASFAADPSQSSSSTSSGSSEHEQVTVAARLRVREQRLEAFGNGRFRVHGRLLPGTGGRRVRLVALHDGHWQTLAAARTGGQGDFSLAFSASPAGPERLRVLFGGDRLNSAADAEAGTVVGFTAGLASWYNDGGNTGCGFHAHYGVANLSLPCGTKVTFSYGGRTVDAVVDDRGPYTGGRKWDLNQNTAAALGFGGVGTVWASQ